MRRVIPAVAALGAALLAGCASTGSPAPTHPAQTQAAPNRPMPTRAAQSASSTTSTAPPAPATRVVPSSSPAPTSSAPTAVIAAQPVNHCAHNSYDQLVLVSISAQHMWLCHGSRTDESNPVTTGMVGQYTETPTGHYQIQGLDRNTVLTLNTGAQYDVKYWIPFDAPLFGFHDSSWQHFPYGSPQYKTAGSHGCVHMPLTAIAFLYHWADIGAHVTIS